MNYMQLMIDTGKTSFDILFKMTYIIIPLLIFIECLKNSGWLDRFASKAKKITHLLRLPGEAALGVTVAFIIGLTYGSGVIVKIREEVPMTKTQLNTLFIFAGICHAMIEETVFFATAGANPFVIAVNRVLMALLFTFLYLGWVGFRTSLADKKQLNKIILK